MRASMLRVGVRAAAGWRLLRPRPLCRCDRGVSGSASFSTAAEQREPRPPPTLPSPQTLQGLLLKGTARITEKHPSDPDADPGVGMFLRKAGWYTETGADTFQLDMPAGAPPMVLTRDIDVVRDILGPKSASFTNMVNSPLGSFFPKSMIVLQGDDWKRVRRLSKKGFSRHRLTNFVREAAEVSQSSFPQLDADMERDGFVQLYPLMQRVTFDTFHRVTYAFDPRTVLGDERNLELLEACEQISDAINRRQMMPIEWLHKLPTPTNRADTRAIALVIERAEEMIKRREDAAAAAVNEDGTADALLDALILSAADADEDGTEAIEGDRLTHEELRDQIFSFFFGAYDTTSAAMSFLFHHLGRNPHWQDELRAAVRDLDLSNTTDKELSKIAVLDAVVKESERIQPVAHAFPRTPVEDVVVGPDALLLRKGSQVLMDWSSITRQRHGMEYDPSRWLQKSGDLKRSVMPFGAGGRMCLGIQIAKIEMRTTIAAFAQQFRWEAVDESLQLRQGIAMAPRDGCRMRFERV